MSLNINEFASSIYALLDSGRYDEAKGIILVRLKEIESAKTINIILLAGIAGFLINR